MAWSRWSGWSSHEEHFHYDAGRGCFVAEESRELDPGRSAPTSGVDPTEYLTALSEIRREVRRNPLGDWEAGQLIRLYATATSLQILRPSMRSIPRRTQRMSPGWQPPDMYMIAANHWLPRLIVDVAESMIRRHHQDAHESLLACLTDKRTGVTDRLNEVARLVQIPDGRAMRAVWLASFDKPYGWRRGGLSDELAIRGPHAVRDFIDTCTVLVRDILANSGSVTHAYTVGAAVAACDESAGD